ncbi:MAG: VOC family protein [Micromonosporaceae bacterium]
MTMQMGGVTIDCEDPRGLAEFWTKAVGYEITQDFEGFFVMLTPTDGGGYIGLQKVPEKRAGKNRVHIDFATQDRKAEVERLIGLGATAVAEHSVPGLTWSVLQDPEGNEFCVGSHHG